MPAMLRPAGAISWPLKGLADGVRPAVPKPGYAFARIALLAFWSMIRADFAPGQGLCRGTGAENQEI
jgi:hypothetical protein